MNFFKSIRIRLTLWYLVVLVILLLLFSAVTYVILAYNLYQISIQHYKPGLMKLIYAFLYRAAK